MTNGGGYLARPAPSGLADVVDTILDKGIVIDAYVRVSLVGIEILTVDARVVVASVDTYLRFAEATNRLELEEHGGRTLPDLMTAGVEKGVSRVAEKVVEDKIEGGVEKVGSAVGKVADKAESVAEKAAEKAAGAVERLVDKLEPGDDEGSDEDSAQDSAEADDDR
jgi:hypothetical protein